VAIRYYRTSGIRLQPNNRSFVGNTQSRFDCGINLTDYRLFSNWGHRRLGHGTRKPGISLVPWIFGMDTTKTSRFHWLSSDSAERMRLPGGTEPARFDSHTRIDSFRWSNHLRSRARSNNTRGLRLFKLDSSFTGGVPMKRLTSLLALLILSIGLVGCGGSDSAFDGDVTTLDLASSEYSPRGGCSSDKDCLSGQGCYHQLGVCLDFPYNNPQFSVAIDPPLDKMVVGDQFVGVTPGLDGNLDLTLASPAVLSGTIFHAADLSSWNDYLRSGEANLVAKGPSCPGKLVATAHGRISGTQLRSEALAVFNDENGVWQYQLPLLPGSSYDATFIPSAADGTVTLPPHRLSLKATSSSKFDIVLPPKDGYVKVDGIVLLAETPVVGAKVSSLIGDLAIGTSAVTDAEGRFSIILPPEAGRVSILVKPGLDSRPFPVTEVAWEEGLEQFMDEYQSSPLVVVKIDTDIPLRQISVQVLSGEESLPVGLAKVTFNGTLAKGSYSTSGITDENGILTLPLFEGSYQVTVVPPGDSGFATTRRVIDLVHSQYQAFMIYLDPRVKIRGTVLDNGIGVPKSNVMLMTDRSDVLTASFSGANDVFFSTMTNDFGEFEVAVDPGRYAITVTPPAGMARTAGASLDLDTDKYLTINLPQATLIRGKVNFATGDLVPAGSRVRFFLNIDDPSKLWAIDGTNFAGELLKIADVIMIQDGFFEDVVPLLEWTENKSGSEEIDHTTDSPPEYDSEPSDSTPPAEDEGGAGFPLPPIQED
jgi:hypothetical protein